MNTKFSSPFTRLALFASLIILPLVSLSAAENAATASVTLSAPDKPATLKIDMPWADIHITGIDGNTITVDSSLNKKGSKENRQDGLRRLDDDVSFQLNEHDNVVSLTLAGDNPWSSHDADFKIAVPHGMALDIKTETGGDLDVTNVTGDIEINTMNGEVRLEGIAGSAVVNTMNGEVHAIYAKVPQKLVSITSMNGEIDLEVPGDTKANVRLRTHNGSILTDFDETVLKTKSEGKASTPRDAARIGADAARSAADAARAAVQVAQDFARELSSEVQRAVRETDDTDVAPSPDARPRPPRPPRPPMAPITGGKLVSGTLNGGGVDIKISTMNGEITLRRTKNPGDSTGSVAATESSKTSPSVTVNFQDPDNFTDVRESHTNMTSTADLEELQKFVQKTALPLLPGGSKLTVTFLDLDFAGMIRPDQDNMRVMTGVTFPRAHVKFQLLGADGKVLKEGERKLTDMNYQQSISIMNRNDPLFYEKELLKDWLRKEFKSNS